MQAYNYIKRLHKSLGHPQPAVLKKMLTEVQATEAVLKAAENFKCVTCYHRKKPFTVPPAAGLTATTFNNRIMADSAWIDTQDGRKCVVTFMDHASRYVTIRILKSERSEEFLKGLERAWIKTFGIPHILRVDEAKGWASQAVRDWCSDRGIILEVAPGEAHNWLAPLERKHQVVRQALEYYMADRGSFKLSTLEEACIYVPHQVNNMSFVNGFTPSQWVFGKTPMSVQSLTAELFNPGIDPLDGQSKFAVLQEKRVAAQHAWIKADSDAKLRRAMNKIYNEYKDEVQVGQLVWYWRKQGTSILQKAKWRGPARVVAKEADEAGRPLVIWLAHGTNLVRCAPHQVRPMVEDQGIPQAADPDAALRDLQDLRARSTTQFRDVYDQQPEIEDQAGDLDEDLFEYSPDVLPGHEEESSHTVRLPLPGIVSNLLTHGEAERERTPRRRMSGEEPEPTPPSTPPPDSPRDDIDDNGDPGPDPDGAGGVLSTEPPPKRQRNRSSRDVRREKTPEANRGTPEEASGSGSKPAEDVRVPTDDEGLFIDDVQLVDARGLPEGWIIVNSNEIELDDAWVVQHLRKSEANEKTMTVDERAQMMQAKAGELQNYFSNNVWDFAGPLSDDDLTRVVTCRWVLVWKTDEATGLPKAKARLVLRGFQDPDVANMSTASPTAGRTARQILLCICGQESWILTIGDVKAAFLSGATFDRKIIAKLPADCGPLLGVVGPCYMKLGKSAYGLSDAPLLWNKEATRRLTEMDINHHKLDSCFFHWRNSKNELGLLLLLHVDDMLICHNPKDKEACEKLAQIRSGFNFGRWQQLKKDEKIAYCGGILAYDNGILTLGYDEYVRKVMPIQIDKKRDSTIPLTPKEVSKCRGLIGALQWPGGQGAPHLCASTSILAGELAAKEGKVMNELNKTLRFSKQNGDVKIHFPKVVDDWKDLSFVGYSDAAHGVRRDLGSQGGFLIVATSPKVHTGAVCRYTPVAWRSYKLTRVCRSSLSAEAQACATAIDELMLVKMMFNMLKHPELEVSNKDVAKLGKSALVIDARALFDATKKPTIQSSLDKRVSIEVMVIRDGLLHTQTELRWVSSERQLADGLTKIGGRQQMAELLRGGHMQLVYDESFQASKKKTQSERKEINKVARGSSEVAMFVATLVAAEVIGAEGSSPDEQKEDNTFLLTVIIGLAMFMFFVYKMAERMTDAIKHVFSKPERVSVNAEIQADTIYEIEDLGYMRTLEKLLRESEEMCTQLKREAEISAEDADLREWKIRDLVDENQRLRAEVTELESRQPVEVTNHDTWLTRYGGVWHATPSCEHLEQRLRIRYRACRTCFPVVR